MIRIGTLLGGLLVMANLVSAAGPATRPATSAPAVSQEGKIITDDLLRIGISDLTGPGIVTQSTRRVDEESKVHLPLVEPVSLKEMTLPQAVDAIAKAYRDANLIPNANVTVVRVESGTAPAMKSGPIAVGDHVRIEIADLMGPGVVTELIRQIPKDGIVQLPQAGKVKLVGMTEARAEKEIQATYRKANLIANAQVGVTRITAKEAEAAEADKKTKSAR